MTGTKKIVIGVAAGLLAVILLGGTVILMVFMSIAGGSQQQSTPTAQCRQAPTVTTAGDSDDDEPADEDEGSEESGALETVPEEYRDALQSASAESGLAVEVLAAQIDQESGWNPDAVSSVGAQGLTQFMPATWDTHGGGGDPFDPDDAIAAQGRYMGVLWDEVEPYAGDDERTHIELTLAAYNAGPGAVATHEGIPPFSETEDYVDAILSVGQGSYTTDCLPIGVDIGELGTGEWVSPMPGAPTTSDFGSRSCPIAAALNCSNGSSDHRGVDFGGPSGSTVVAPMDIEIRATGVIDGWEQLGWVVLGKMPDEPGLHVEFAHCASDSIQVDPGDTVAPGTPLCTQGNTGASAGDHLHLQFGLPEGDESVPGWENLIDPEPFLRAKGVI
ncbi:transglycosylase SLT domain-containing protein [Nesterenkonia sp. CF4.4]|uniref:transglycosylase SLT domain-containing protein n=1 Tax=Nesterenkonia sp. CF4.4 TaxID=3373079 RepID=UPI003EE4F772